MLSFKKLQRVFNFKANRRLHYMPTITCLSKPRRKETKKQMVNTHMPPARRSDVSSLFCGRMSAPYNWLLYWYYFEVNQAKATFHLLFPATILQLVLVAGQRPLVASSVAELVAVRGGEVIEHGGATGACRKCQLSLKANVA